MSCLWCPREIDDNDDEVKRRILIFGREFNAIHNSSEKSFVEFRWRHTQNSTHWPYEIFWFSTALESASTATHSIGICGFLCVLLLFLLSSSRSYRLFAATHVFSNSWILFDWNVQKVDPNAAGEVCQQKQQSIRLSLLTLQSIKQTIYWLAETRRYVKWR